MGFNWFLLFLAYFSLFALGLADNARGPVFPDLLREFSLSDSAGSLFFFAASAASLLNNVFAFYWLKKLGSERALKAFMLALVLGLLGVGYSERYPGVVLASVLFGASMGGLGIALNLSVSEAVPAHRRRQALSGLHCMYGVASLAAPLVVTGVYHRGGSWQGVFLVLAILPVILLVGSWFIQKRKVNPQQEEELLDAEVGDLSLAEKRKDFNHVLSLAIMIACYAIAEIAVSSRLVLYARRDVGLSVEKANLLLSAFFLFLFLGRLFFAVVHLPLRNWTILFVSGGVSLVVFCLGLVHDPVWLAFTGLTMSMFYPCAMAMVHDETGRDAGSATSWVLIVQSLGLTLMHFALGYLSDRFSLGRALWIGPLCLILVLVYLGKIRTRQVT